MSKKSQVLLAQIVSQIVLIFGIVFFIAGGVKPFNTELVLRGIGIMVIAIYLRVSSS